MAVSDASITTTTAANYIPEIWADESLDAVEFATTIQKRVNTDYKGMLKVGDTLHIARRSNLSTQTKSSGVSNTINFEAITEGVQDITVSTHEYAAFLIENVVEVQTNQDLRRKYTKAIGYALARGREVALAALPQNLSSGQQIGTYGVELTYDNYLSMWQLFAEAGLLEDSPDPSADFSLFVSPAAYAALLKVDSFVNSDYNSSADAIGRAHVGDIFGFPVYISNLLRSPSAGQHDCFAMHRDCYGFIVQKEVNVVSQYLIRNLADGVAGWNLYGHAEINFPPETPGGGTAVDNRGVLLKTK